jgi:hypothetical protein
MKACFILLCIALNCSANAQVPDSCVGSQLKTIDVLLLLNGFSYKDSLYLNPAVFKEKIELGLPSPGVSVRGYRILANCDGCSIWEVSVCGNKVPEKYRKLLCNFFEGSAGWLEFYAITVEIQGRQYFARPMMVFPSD